MPPCLRVSFNQVLAFAFGIPSIVYEFYLYNKNFSTPDKLVAICMVSMYTLNCL